MPWRAAAALAMVALIAADATAVAACPLHGTRNYARKADLPAGALAAFGTPMAERRQPFQATDVLDPRHRMPSTRFVAARQIDCALAIRYEQGGIAHTWNTATLELRGNRWVLVSRRYERPPR